MSREFFLARLLKRNIMLAAAINSASRFFRDNLLIVFKYIVPRITLRYVDLLMASKIDRLGVV